MKKSLVKRRTSKGKKSRIAKVNKKIADKSIDAITATTEPTSKSKKAKVNKFNRRAYGVLAMLCVLVVGVILSPNLWFVNKFVKSIDKSGGTYIEGSVSSVGNLNPIFSSETAEKAIGKLIFSSLFRYDEDENLVGDLAQDWSANEDNTIFTVNLKPDLQWTDDESINADDVLKTYELIQHPDSESPLRNSWRGIKVNKVDDLTVTFALANSYSPFVKSLTNPIVPEHIFTGLPAREIRLSDFSQQPLINSGPFSFKRISDDSTEIELEANPNYHGTKPNIEEFIVKTYDSTQEMLSDFRSGGLSAMAGVDLNEISNNSELKSVADSENTFYMPTNTASYLFLKNDHEILKDVKVRQAISKAIDTSKIADNSYGLIYPLNTVLLPSQQPQDSDTLRETFNHKTAQDILEKAEWKVNESTGVREKDGEQLQFTIYVQNSGVFPIVGQEIARQLFDVGVLATIQEVKPSQLQQNHIRPHSYDAVIFGFETSNDPDVFPLWHSSQKGIGGFNLSEISDSIIDETLEAGRTRSDQELRDNNYTAFTERWHARIPAIPLYQPNYVYITKDNIKGIQSSTLNSSEDRFAQISSWYVD